MGRQSVLMLQLAALLLAAAGAAGRQGRRPARAQPSMGVLEPWAEQLGEEGAAAHASMAKWLTAFFASEPADALFPTPPRLPRTKPRRQRLPPLEVALYNESAVDRHIWTKWNASGPCSDALRAAPRPARRTNLVVAPVGSGFDAAQWLTHPEHATYDIVALYYGASPETFTCPLCKAVRSPPRPRCMQPRRRAAAARFAAPGLGRGVRSRVCGVCLQVVPMRGTKWFLMHALAKQNATLWAQLARDYAAVMVADDDLLFDTCTLNRREAAARRYYRLGSIIDGRVHSNTGWW